MSVIQYSVQYMLCEYSHKKPGSLVQIRANIAEIQIFLGGCFYWRSLYVCGANRCIVFFTYYRLTIVCVCVIVEYNRIIGCLLVRSVCI